MKRKMFGQLFSFCILLIAVAVSMGYKKQADRPAPEKGLVLVELFTSQGCSSCPPADALLGEYANAKDSHVLPLSFHVDYWNRLGWKDPFSSAAFSERQQQYSRQMHLDGVYTPQVVINGRTEAVGNNRNALQRLVAQQQAMPASTSISITEIITAGNTLRFQYSLENADPTDRLEVALAQKKVVTQIKAGENSGVTLTNHNIVRAFSSQALIPAHTGSIDLPAGFSPADYILVIFLQSRSNMAVHAVAAKNCG